MHSSLYGAHGQQAHGVMQRTRVQALRTASHRQARAVSMQHMRGALLVRLSRGGAYVWGMQRARVQALWQHVAGRRAPSACSTCAVLLLVRLSSWWRLRSSTMALTAATASTNSSDSVGPYGANGLTTAHHARLACASVRITYLLLCAWRP